MTREEQRMACAKAIGNAIWHAKHGYDGGLAQGYAAFDALHDLVLVNPIEATEEMETIGDTEALKHGATASSVWRAMSAAGDLTNQPEKNP